MVFNDFEGHLGAIWGHLGAILGHFGAILGLFGAILGSLGAILGHLGAILGPLLGFLGPSSSCISYGATAVGWVVIAASPLPRGWRERLYDLPPREGQSLSFMLLEIAVAVTAATVLCHFESLARRIP